MRKILLATLLCATSAFAQVKISSLPQLPAVSGAESIPVSSPPLSTTSSFQVSPNQLAAYAQTYFSANGLALGSPVGGSQGVGSINATSLFINGVSIPVAVSPTLTGTVTATGNIIDTNSFTYGFGANAVAGSYVTNSAHIPQVMGTFGTPSLMGGYAERDSVGLYVDNTAPALVATSAGTFTATQFLPTVALSGAVVAKLRVGMIIDTNDATKYSGIITSFVANGTSITVSNWYLSPGPGTPATPSGTTAFINPVTKIFGANVVATIPSSGYATASAGVEFDLNDLSSNTATNTTWGVDSTNLTNNAGRDAYIARGAWDYGIESRTFGTASFFANPTGGSVNAGFLSAQTTGNAFQASGAMASGFYFRSNLFNVNFNGQVDVGNQSSVSASPLVFHSSGHAGGDASLTASGGTGASDGSLAITASGGVTVNGATVSTAVRANPSATAGLAAVNGSAATWMSSDSAPAISQSIAPSWSGVHTFTSVYSGGGTASNAPVFLKSTLPAISWDVTGQALDTKVWEMLGNGAVWQLRIVHDDGTVAKNVISATRAAGVVSTINLGNATDATTVSYNGPLIAAGTQFPISGGTGACATQTTKVGGALAGNFTCTGTTGASTVSITLPAATNAYSCQGRDITTPTTVTQTGAVSTTSITLTLTSVTANDVIQFSCLGY